MSGAGESAALDPVLAGMAAAAASAPVAPLHTISPAEARDRVRAGNALCSDGPALHVVEDVAVPLPDADVRARVYRPDPGTPRATLVYFHGGGWVTGDLDYSDELCRRLARDAGWTVVSVDYRLAPEHPYPAPLSDARRALAWAARAIAGGGPLAVGGDSAGGNLAAACTLHARDHGGPDLAFQLLIYPVTDHDTTRASYLRHADGFPIGAAAMRWFWDHYAPGDRGVPALAPLRAADLSGLPPAHVVVAGHDPLHDEGVAYAERLRASGVETDLRDHAGLVHGFLRMTGAVPAAGAALDELVRTAASMFGDRRPHRPVPPDRPGTDRSEDPYGLGQHAAQEDR